MSAPLIFSPLLLSHTTRVSPGIQSIFSSTASFGNVIAGPVNAVARSACVYSLLSLMNLQEARFRRTSSATQLDGGAVPAGVGKLPEAGLPGAVQGTGTPPTCAAAGACCSPVGRCARSRKLVWNRLLLRAATATAVTLGSGHSGGSV